jgi:hypothetical protein
MVLFQLNCKYHKKTTITFGKHHTNAHPQPSAMDARYILFGVYFVA